MRLFEKVLIWENKSLNLTNWSISVETGESCCLKWWFSWHYMKFHDVFHHFCQMSKFPWHLVKFPDNSLTLRNFISLWHFPDGYEPWPAIKQPIWFSLYTCSNINGLYHMSVLLILLIEYNSWTDYQLLVTSVSRPSGAPCCLHIKYIGLSECYPVIPQDTQASHITISIDLHHWATVWKIRPLCNDFCPLYSARLRCTQDRSGLKQFVLFNFYFQLYFMSDVECFLYWCSIKFKPFIHSMHGTILSPCQICYGITEAAYIRVMKWYHTCETYTHTITI